MADIKSLGDQLVSLTVKEVNDLAQYLKDEYKIRDGLYLTKCSICHR